MDPNPSPWTLVLFPVPCYFNQCCECLDVLKIHLWKLFLCKLLRWVLPENGVCLWNLDGSSAMFLQKGGSFHTVGDLVGPLLSHIVPQVRALSVCWWRCSPHSIHVCMCAHGVRHLWHTGHMCCLLLELHVFTLCHYYSIDSCGFFASQGWSAFLWPCAVKNIFVFVVYFFQLSTFFLILFWPQEEPAVSCLSSGLDVTHRTVLFTLRCCTYVFKRLGFIHLLFNPSGILL